MDQYSRCQRGDTSAHSELRPALACNDCLRPGRMPGEDNANDSNLRRHAQSARAPEAPAGHRPQRLVVLERRSHLPAAPGRPRPVGQARRQPRGRARLACPPSGSANWNATRPSWPTWNGCKSDLDRYLNLPSWFEGEHEDLKDGLIGYFSLEFGLHESLPLYSGGLGILAGDHLKSATDLGLPLVGVGLAYQYGYFRQYLNHDGWQMEEYPVNDFYNMSMSLEQDEDGQPSAPSRSTTPAAWSRPGSGACRSAATPCSCWTPTCPRTGPRTAN